MKSQNVRMLDIEVLFPKRGAEGIITGDDLPPENESSFMLDQKF